MIKDFLTIRNPRVKILVVAIPCAIAFCIFRLRTGLSPFQLKCFLLSSESLMLWLNLLLCAAGLWWSRESLRSCFREVPASTGYRLLAITLLSFLVRGFVPPHGHGLFFDEDIYLNIAQNMVHHGRPDLACFGYFRWDDYFHVDGILNKQPNGYPALLSLFFLLFGVNEKVPAVLSIVLSALSPFLLFLLVRRIYAEKPALWSALFLSLSPTAVKWAPTCSTEPAFAFFTLLTLFMLSLYCSNRQFKVAFAAFMLLSFTVQFRPEGILLIPVSLLFLVLFFRDPGDYLEEMRFSAIFLLFCTFTGQHLLHLLAFTGDTWGAVYRDTFAITYLLQNMRANLSFFVTNQAFPLAFTICAITGIFACLKKWRELLFVLGWLGAFFAPYLFFYAGSYWHPTGMRFSLMILAPVCILSSLGMERIRTALESRSRVKAGYLLASLLFIFFIPFLTWIRTPDLQTWAERFSHQFIVREAQKLPRDSIIFTHTPPMVIIATKRGALQSYYGSDREMVDRVFQHTRHVYFFRDYWCYSLSCWGNYAYFCENFTMTPVATEKLHEIEYTLYRVERKDQ